MKQAVNPKKRRIIWIILVSVVVIIGAIAGFLLLSAPKENPVENMTFEQCLAYTTKDTPHAKVGVVVLQNGQANISFYGNNAGRIPYETYEFEIGSLTKTITAALVLRAVSEGALSLSDPVNRFVLLPDQAYYPTIERLLTHQSGYKNFYFERPMFANFLSGENSFYNISQGTLRRRVGKVHLQDRDYPFSYSNFGISVLGLVLEDVYQTSYTELVNAFVQQELGMQHTRVSDGTGNLSGYWNWAENDAYMPAGALISTADDMALYARVMLQGSPNYLAQVQKPIAKVNATTDQLASLSIRMDSVGATWIIDDEYGIVWHNGGTSYFASYHGFDPERQIAVVILTNLSPGYRIPATVLGAKLLIELQNQAG
ncbi:MAG: serine hydrolase domain-containing protein [Eubacteriales bacterium]|jgi:CubicO group peptidase (beta-lactamase class C family)|nr:serine hydrolase domain-containing protein [Eubacteriales bacterium]